MKISKPYYVSRENTTTDEPNPGWYFSVEGDEGICVVIHGPYSNRDRVDEAIDGLEVWQSTNY